MLDLEQFQKILKFLYIDLLQKSFEKNFQFLHSQLRAQLMKR